MENQQGQVTVLLAGVIALAMVLMMGIALVGQAMVQRARARNAADAIALAVVTNPTAADQLMDGYRDRGIEVNRDGDRVIASTGSSRAAAWAATAEGEVERSPALVAIVSRAEQLAATEFTEIRWAAFSVSLKPSEAGVLEMFADGLGLCEDRQSTRDDLWRTFQLCSGSG